jgi:peptidoglycan/LPS O-acetylase OafA/YrhL
VAVQVINCPDWQNLLSSVLNQTVGDFNSVFTERAMSNERNSVDFLKTKQHFEVLDGLRGVAALSIVVFHFMEWIFTDFSKNFIGHGYLAVDFFFCLSGFVVAYAYDDRIKEMGLTQFFKSRLIRLYPLVVMGSILGLLAFFLDPFASSTTVYDISKVVIIFVASILLIPFGIMEDRAFNLFGLNAPAWSLFWEYIANIFYAFVLYKISRRPLLLLTILAAIGIVFISYKSGNLVGGWSKNNFWDGCGRVSFSFLVGVLIYRSNWIIKNNLGFIGPSFLLLGAFLMPFFKLNWMVEALIVILYFPLLVSLGAGATIGSLKKVAEFSGKLSYPLYMTHYAAIWIFGNYLTKYKPEHTKLSIIVIGGALFLVAFAWLVTTLYDVPVRKYLQKKRLPKT